jgi:peptidoglycan/LPS O-acetylase OafA/YrhL
VTVAASAAARPRLVASDALRVVAAIGVVLIHSSAWGPASPYSGVNLITRYSVPAFMVLTGILLGYQYTGRALGLRFVERRASRTLIPWLAWMPVFFVFDLLIGSLRVSLSGLAYSYSTGFGHLWYLLLIPQLYVVFAFWPRRWSWTVALVATAVQTALCVVRIAVTLPSGWESQLMVTYGFLLFPFWIGYFGIGVAAGRALLARNMRAVPDGARWRTPLIVASAAAVGASGFLLLNLHFQGSAYKNLQGTGSFLNPVLPLFTLSIVVFVFASAPAVMARSAALARTLRFLGDLSLGIYIVHPIFLWFFGRMMVGKLAIGGPVSIVSFLTMVLAVLVCTVIAVRIVVATPLAITFGLPRQPIRLERNVPVLSLRS